MSRRFKLFNDLTLAIKNSGRSSNSKVRIKIITGLVLAMRSLQIYCDPLHLVGLWQSLFLVNHIQSCVLNKVLNCQWLQIVKFSIGKPIATATFLSFAKHGSPVGEKVNQSFVSSSFDMTLLKFTSSTGSSYPLCQKDLSGMPTLNQ